MLPLPGQPSLPQSASQSVRPAGPSKAGALPVWLLQLPLLSQSGTRSVSESPPNIMAKKHQLERWNTHFSTVVEQEVLGCVPRFSNAGAVGSVPPRA